MFWGGGRGGIVLPPWRESSPEWLFSLISKSEPWQLYLGWEKGFLLVDMVVAVVVGIVKSPTQGRDRGKINEPPKWPQRFVAVVCCKSFYHFAPSHDVF